MARASSQAGPAELPQLVERLHADGDAAVAAFTQEELETIVDDLPLALESESIRAHLGTLLGAVVDRPDRTFRRVIEIARQDEGRIPLLLAALPKLRWNGTPTEDEFAWLVQQMSRNADPAGRLFAFERAASLTLHSAQHAILDALGGIHPDERIREAHRRLRDAAGAPGADVPAETTGELVVAQEAARRETATPPPAADVPPAPDPERAPSSPPGVMSAWGESASEPKTAAGDEPAVFDESLAQDETWKQKDEPQPDRLTVRTLLRSLEEPAPSITNLAARAPEPPNEDPKPVAGSPDDPTDEPTIADDADEPTPIVENSLSDARTPAAASPTTPVDEADDAPRASVADESTSPEAAAAAAAAAPENPRAEPITVRTLLSSLDTVMLSNAPDADPPAAGSTPVSATTEGVDVWNETEQPPERVTVMTMLRSLETVRVKMAALEETPIVSLEADARDRSASGNGAGAPASPGEPPGIAPVSAKLEPERPRQEPKPWSDVDLKPLSPPDRARRLAKVRRDLKTPELKRGYLHWLLDREKDAFSVVSVRKEILEYAFERPTFLGFDTATRGKLGRWIRERTAAEQIAPAAVLAALRRATWIEGEPPHVDDETRPIVDAATGALARVPSEERATLFNRDFSAWLFSIREFEDREVLDRYARDAHPGVAEGLFRALAAMDALSARFGGTGGASPALEIALGLWDRADNEARTEMAKAIAGGWSRGFVLDRRSFFDAFWQRHQKFEEQRAAILVALASFEKEFAEANAKAGGAPLVAGATAIASPSPSAPVSPAPVMPPAPDEATTVPAAVGPVPTISPAATPTVKTAMPEEEAPEPAPAPRKRRDSIFVEPPRDPSEAAAPPAAEAALSAPDEPATPAAPDTPSEPEKPAARSMPPWEVAPVAPRDDSDSKIRSSGRSGPTRPVVAKEVTRPAAKAPGFDADAGTTTAKSPAPRKPATEQTDPAIGTTAEKAARRPTLAPPPADPPSLATTARTQAPPPSAAEPQTSTAGGPDKPAFHEGVQEDEATDRFFRMMRKNMEAGMRATGPATAPPSPAHARPASPAPDEPTADDIDLPEEGDTVDGVLPDEGDVVLESSAPKPPQPAAQPGRSDKDDEQVLPNEPLRTLTEYTRFLRALSAGSPIDELLGDHGMDYKQYAGCMTAWGKLLQTRPDLAVRMGQLLQRPNG